MRKLLQPLLLVTLVLLVPVVPFLGFGEALEARVAAWFEPPPPPAVTFAATAGVLASDIFLPVPSSVVSTLAGAQFGRQFGAAGGIALATAASWLGLSLGSVAGFWLARRWGRPAAARFAAAADLDQMHALAQRFGAPLVICTRPLPILAEAAVLLVGMTGMAWRQFLPALLISNLGIAAMYSILGHLAHRQGELAWAVAASVVLPLAATGLARLLWPHARPTAIAKPAPSDDNSLSNDE